VLVEQVVMEARVVESMVHLVQIHLFPEHQLQLVVDSVVVLVVKLLAVQADQVVVEDGVVREVQVHQDKEVWVEIQQYYLHNNLVVIILAQVAVQVV
jgi:hypothetical protein